MRALALLFIPALSFADDTPAPAASRIGDANLESVQPRSGTTLSLSFVPDVVVGTGTAADTGTGGGISARVGQVAAPDTIVTLELTGGAVLVHRAIDKKIYQNSTFNLAVGAQRYFADSLWVRLAGGLGNYTRRGQFDRVGTPAPDESLTGPVGVFGVGIDAVRVHKWVVDLEVCATFLLERHGVTAVSGLGVGFAHY